MKRSEKELEDALRAKFTQNPELNVLLKATKKAKLQGFVRGLKSCKNRVCNIF